MLGRFGVVRAEANAAPIYLHPPLTALLSPPPVPHLPILSSSRTDLNPVRPYPPLAFPIFLGIWLTARSLLRFSSITRIWLQPDLSLRSLGICTAWQQARLRILRLMRKPARMKIPSLSSLIWSSILRPHLARRSQHTSYARFEFTGSRNSKAWFGTCTRNGCIRWH